MTGSGRERDLPGLVPWPRALLFTPADDERRLAGAAGTGAEAVIADLEDAVASDRKTLAREHAVAFLECAAPSPPARIVRINDPCTETGRLDLASVAERHPAALMVPKASVEGLELVRASGVSVIALIETAHGVADVERIAAREEVVALAIGTVDLAAELGLGQLPGGLELLYARSRIVLAAALAGIPAIDGVHVDLADADGLREEARRARALGFAAKLCIHPAQLPVVRQALAPTAAEIAHARLVIATYERSLGGRRGVSRVGAEMVDLASVRRARRTLEGLGD